MSLTISRQDTDQSTRIVVCGEVDVSNADALRDALDEALAAPKAELTVDLSETSYIDSTGIGVLVGAAHRAEGLETSFGVESPQRNVARVLNLLGVGDKLGLRP